MKLEVGKVEATGSSPGAVIWRQLYRMESTRNKLNHWTSECCRRCGRGSYFNIPSDYTQFW